MSIRKFGNERSVVTPDDSQDQHSIIETVGAQTDHGEPEPSEHHDIPLVGIVDEEGRVQ